VAPGEKLAIMAFTAGSPDASKALRDLKMAARASGLELTIQPQMGSLQSLDAHSTQSRFAFARNGPTIASDAFKQALAVAGVHADTPATVLCDGDAGLWRLQREALPKATVVLDWWLRPCAAGGPRTWRWLGRHPPGRRGGSRNGACEVAFVARALAGMPAQTHCLVSLDAGQACA
jgi:hypothetical protein